MSGQDEPNSALWLATGAGKIRSRLRAVCSFNIPYNNSFIDQAGSVNLPKDALE